jgi:DNA-3-methyladenine glycosylase
MILPLSFYLHEDVVEIARELLGKHLCTKINGIVSSGIICETEAYAGTVDKASHAYGGRRTERTEIMYRQGGVAYIYLCYGVHSLFNVVTNQSDIPHAVLIRGIKPSEGITEMKQRSGKNQLNNKSGTGPGKVTKLLGIHYSMTGQPLTSSVENDPGTQIWIEDRGWKMEKDKIRITPRIGVDYAGNDAMLPYRFVAVFP